LALTRHTDGGQARHTDGGQALGLFPSSPEATPRQVGFVLPEAERAVFFIILCGKEVCIGFCLFEVWLCFFGARMGDKFS
jgi:hypothetical protein